MSLLFFISILYLLACVIIHVCTLLELFLLPIVLIHIINFSIFPLFFINLQLSKSLQRGRDKNSFKKEFSNACPYLINLIIGSLALYGIFGCIYFFARSFYIAMGNTEVLEAVSFTFNKGLSSLWILCYSREFLYAYSFRALKKIRYKELMQEYSVENLRKQYRQANNI
ncbi:MAG: hypothetical protein FVQ79_06745 [Planctomycetes bacterium]|nr:hypothetical protein [Planctomycetota bacterium]